MTICYLVPGLGGTTLRSGAFPPADVWLSYTQIGLGRVGALRLAPDGSNPGDPDGEPLTPLEPLDDYYRPCRDALRRGLAGRHYEVQYFGYDWRKSALVTGELLAQAVRIAATAADPCSIVAHSHGGLVARVAWASLTASGETALVRRIITLGTPHQGSYGAVRLFSLDLDALAALSRLTQLTLPPLVAVVGPFAPRAWTRADLSALAGTWPGLYETLPSLLGAEVATDPGRSAVYGAGWPATRGVSAAWLSYAQRTWQPFLLQPATIPPPWVLTTVAGIQYGTASKLLHPAALGRKEAYNLDGDGDGLVTEESALLPGSKAYSLMATHADLPNQTATLGLLAQWVLDVRNPPAPPPPAVRDRTARSRILAGPPIPAPEWDRPDPP